MMFISSLGVVLTGLVTVALATDHCHQFNTVSGDVEYCHATHFRHISYMISFDNSTELMWVYEDDCRHLEAYISCMDNFTEGCSNTEAIMTEVRQSMNICNGTQVSDWFTNIIAPVFDRFSMECFRMMHLPSVCNEVIDEMDLDFPTHRTTTEDGIKLIKQLKAAYLECNKKNIPELSSTISRCRDIPWQVTYVGGMAYIMGMEANRPLGVYLEQGDIQSFVGMEIDAFIADLQNGLQNAR